MKPVTLQSLHVLCHPHRRFFHTRQTCKQYEYFLETQWVSVFFAIAYPEMSVINGSVLWCIAHAETHQAFKAACEISGIEL
jgi:hypothetical protein